MPNKKEQRGWETRDPRAVAVFPTVPRLPMIYPGILLIHGGTCIKCKQSFQNQVYVDMSSANLFCLWRRPYQRHPGNSNVDNLKSMAALRWKLTATAESAFFSAPGRDVGSLIMECEMLIKKVAVDA